MLFLVNRIFLFDILNVRIYHLVVKFLKIVTLFFLTLCALFLFAFPVSAQATQLSTDYIIEDFESILKVQQNTSVTVSEKLTVNYKVQKHGIFRVIPSVYTINGKTLNTNLSVSSVTDEKGNPYKFTTSRDIQSVSIKIGDPDTVISGRHVYVVNYRVKDFVIKYNGLPEFYWNITGHEWDVPILNAAATLESPHAKITKVTCYAGVYKSTAKDCKATFTENLAEFTATKQINPGSDFTIVTGFDPVNNLQFPGPVSQATKKISDNWGYAAAFVPLVLIFILWWKNGRDEKFIGDNIYYRPDNLKTENVPFFKRKFLPTVYSPINGLTPSEVGTIVDERVDTHDLIAEIMELGRLGIIKIERIEKKGLFGKDDYSFTKLPGTEIKESKLKDFQAEILKELFRKTSIHKTTGLIDKIFKNNPTKKKEAEDLIIENRYVLLSALKLNFYEALEVIKDKLYKSLVDDEIFARDPEKSRNSVTGLFILLSILYIAFVLTFFYIYTLNAGPFLLAMLSIPVGCIFAANMPKRKAWGYSLFRQAEGLKHYLEIGKWRQEIAEKELFVKEMLPLAIALRVVDRLADDMKELGIKPPEYMSNFTVSNFSNDFVRFQTTAAASMVAGSSGGHSWSGRSSWSGGSGFSGGGGGGFSGGGGGGGGGGSW